MVSKSFTQGSSPGFHTLYNSIADKGLSMGLALSLAAAGGHGSPEASISSWISV